ncbi:hypothetical protein U9M48_030252 [Paspalum notatum var. saurae]|uniref:Uncharacterized protein n=1 Tax=Paspalum notatum var. saurae TaxID=547442 RepID=A0AAQ3U4Z8_PASNO
MRKLYELMPAEGLLPKVLGTSVVHVSLVPVLNAVGEQATNIVALYDVSNIWRIPLLLRALLHASVDCRRKLVVDWVASMDLEDSTAIERTSCITGRKTKKQGNGAQPMA